MTEPRIYVACLASYNNGILFGRWIDASSDVGEMAAEIAEMLADSPEPGAEEYAIHDYEGFGNYRLSEYGSLATIAAMVAAQEETNAPFEAVCEFMTLNRVDDIADLTEQFQEAYEGEWESFRDYAEHYFDETCLSEIPERLQSYVDYDKYARDLGQDFTWSGGYVFRD